MTDRGRAELSLSAPVRAAPVLVSGAQALPDAVGCRQTPIRPAVSGNRACQDAEHPFPHVLTLTQITEWNSGKRIASGTHCKAWKGPAAGTKAPSKL